MRYIVIILWIACLGACNPDVKQKVTVNGKLTNYKGNKIYFEISGRDSLVKAEAVRPADFLHVWSWMKGLMCA